MNRVLLLLVVLFCTPFAAASDVLNLQSHSGKVVIIDFWASWCVPCRRSFPWMNAMHQKYAADGLVIIAVNLDRSADAAARFLAKRPASFDIVYDPQGELARAYKVEVMPSSIVIGRDGEVIARHAGFKVRRQDEYEATLRAELGLKSEE